MKTHSFARWIYFLFGILTASVIFVCIYVAVLDHTEEKLGVLCFQTVDSVSGLPVEINEYEDPAIANVNDEVDSRTPKQYTHFDEGSRHYICFIGSEPVNIVLRAKGYEDVTVTIPTVDYSWRGTSVENALVKIKMKKK
jgi:hypothetical protein